jgi:hypothetical protein
MLLKTQEMSKTEIITFRTTLELKSALIEKAQSLGLSLSDMVEFMVKDYHENAEKWKQNQIDKQTTEMMLRSVRLRSALFRFNNLVSDINAAKENGVAYPKQIDLLLKQISTLYSDVRSGRLTDQPKEK